MTICATVTVACAQPRHVCLVEYLNALMNTQPLGLTAQTGKRVSSDMLSIR